METLTANAKNMPAKAYIELRYDAANGWIYANWTGYMTTEQVKEGLENILSLIKEKKAKKILNDNRELKGTWTQANEWIISNWFPRALAADLKAIAYIYSSDVFGKFSVDQLRTRFNDYESNTFSDIEPAQDWLKSV